MVNRVPGFVLNPIGLLSNFLSGGNELPHGLLPPGRTTYLTQSCRTAIHLIPTLLSLEPGDEILFPAYNCGSEYDALRAWGLTPKVVDCAPDGTLELDVLARALGPKTRALYLIHLFGWPHPIDAIDAWRKEKGLYLIEDCALSLFSRYPNGTSVGTHGEAAVYSLPKFLPVPDGGLLSLKEKPSTPLQLQSPPVLKSVRSTASLVKAWSLTHLPANAPESIETSIKEETRPGTMPASYYFEDWRKDRSACLLTRRFFSRLDVSIICSRRRQNFRILHEALKPLGLAPLHTDLPEGTVPLFYPMPMPGRRDRVVAALTKAGVSTSPFWDGGHQNINWADFPNASALKKSVVPLPLHQGLDAQHMTRLISIVSKICS